MYGSLRSYFRSPAYDYIARYFDLIGEGTVQGKLFDLGEFSGAIPAAEATIEGELYKIKNEREFAWAICQLDDYEGTSAEPFEQPLYRREITEVSINNDSVQAWIYWYSGDVTGKHVITSGNTVTYQQSK